MKAIARLALAAGAAALAAWFGLGWIQAKDTGRAESLVSAKALSPAKARQAQSLLAAAATLNPDRTVDVLRGELAAALHHFRGAESRIEAVTRAEPQNLQAWEQLTLVAYDAKDFQLAAVAFRRLKQLVREPK